MSDMDFDFNCFGKEKDTPRIWDTGNVKEESRRILDDDRDAILNGPTPDEEDIKENEQTKKALSIEERNVEKGSETSDRDATKFFPNRVISEKIDRTRPKEEKRNWVLLFLMHASWFIRIGLYGTTGFVHVVCNFIKLMYHILTKTAKYCKGTMRDKFLFAPLILLMFRIVIAPEMSPDETFLQTSVVGSVEVGNNIILVCTCRGICTGNKRWTEGSNNIELSYNQRVFKDNINIIKNSYAEYSIEVSKATNMDIESNYTCHIGLASKQINRSELEQHVPSQPSPTQSPTVTSTPQQPKKSNTGKLSDGKIIGIVVGVGVFVGVVAVIVFLIRKYKYKKPNINRRRNDDGL